MAAAIITLEDSGTEGVIASIRFTGGGFDKSSHAHQHAVIVMAAAEEFLERNGASIEDAEAKLGNEVQSA